MARLTAGERERERERGGGGEGGGEGDGEGEGEGDGECWYGAVGYEVCPCGTKLTITR